MLRTHAWMFAFICMYVRMYITYNYFACSSTVRSFVTMWDCVRVTLVCAKVCTRCLLRTHTRYTSRTTVIHGTTLYARVCSAAHDVCARAHLTTILLIFCTWVVGWPAATCPPALLRCVVFCACNSPEILSGQWPIIIYIRHALHTRTRQCRVWLPKPHRMCPHS